jgi:hypothetical protein
VDAIQVVLEDAAGQSLQAFQVYRRDANAQYVYDQVHVEQASPSIFIGLPEIVARPKKWWEFWK